jgi:SAM-dependent methyltransferase
MCNAWCIQYWSTRILKEEVEGKRVIEVGSLDINGSLRSIIGKLNPAEYIGVDITEGQGVDIICYAEDIIERFGTESFDFVVSTEMIEHVEDWRKVVSNIKNICKSEGTIIVTTRSKGFPVHGFPDDFWRYEVEDMSKIFSDCIVEILEPDESEPGVFMKAKKPKGFVELDLSSYALYSVKSLPKEKQNLKFILGEGENRVVITEDLVVEMYDKIDQMRLMGEPLKVSQGDKSVVVTADMVIKMYNKLEQAKGVKKEELTGPP